MSNPKKISAGICLLSVIHVIAGCSTTPRTIPRYAWEAAQEQEYTQTFRGRWWSYYDRGLWNLLRGNYEAAEADLLAAKARRADDQLWPRTYGLHFLPEYFPNRELGITYHRMGRQEESIRLLEQSLRQQYSARASYYLDLARAQHIKAQKLDRELPVFRLIAPSPGQRTGDVYTQLVGEAQDDTFVKEIYVNGEPVDIRVSRPIIEFRHPIALAAGQNHVTVRIVDLVGNETIKDVMVEADHAGPVVSFSGFDAETQTVEGFAYDSAGIRSLTIAGEPAALDGRPGGPRAFRTTLPVDPGTNDVPYRCEDVNGNLTQGYLRTNGDAILTRGTPVEKTRLAMASETIATVPDFSAAQTSSTDPEFRAALVNLDDQQRFYQPTITVNIHVHSPVPVEAVEFNGEPIAIIPAQRVFSLSQTLGLGSEPNEILCSVVATNREDEQASDEKRIFRDLSPIETEEGKLSFAVVDVDNTHPLLSDTEARQLINDIAREPGFRDRFGGLVVRDDEMIQAMLQEHELAQLSSDEHRLLTEEVQTADVLLAARVEGTEDFIQIVLEGMSTTVNRIITNRVEAAGEFGEAALHDHARALAFRLAQEFPRLQAPAVDATSNGVYFPIFREDGIRPYYNCVFVEKVSIGSGRWRQEQLEIRGQGFIENAEREPRFSRARFDFGEAFVENLAIDPASETYFVVTK